MAGHVDTFALRSMDLRRESHPAGAPEEEDFTVPSAEASQPVEEKTAGSATRSSPGPDPRAAARSGFPAVAPRLAGGRLEVSAPSRTTARESHTPQLARGDEIEARRIAAELDRLHRDGAIASKAALDPDAVFYARLLRDFGATCTGRSGSRQNAPKILPDGEFAPRPGAENQWKVPDPPPGLNWAERQKFYMDDLRDAIGDEWITAPPGCPATGVLTGSEIRTAEMTRDGQIRALRRPVPPKDSGGLGPMRKRATRAGDMVGCYPAGRPETDSRDRQTLPRFQGRPLRH